MKHWDVFLQLNEDYEACEMKSMYQITFFSEIKSMGKKYKTG